MPNAKTIHFPRPSREAEQFPRDSMVGSRILVVDDEAVIADTITKILLLYGFTASAAYDGDSALQSALMAPPRLLLTDVALPGMNGFELAESVKRIYPDCKILLFSGQASTNDLLATARRKGQDFTLLSKPMAPDQLLAMVAEHLNAPPPKCS